MNSDTVLKECIHGCICKIVADTGFCEGKTCKYFFQKSDDRLKEAINLLAESAPLAWVVGHNKTYAHMWEKKVDDFFKQEDK